MANLDKEVAVLLVPFPAQSHLNMSLNLSHVLSSYNMPVHYASSTQHIRQVKLRNPEIISSLSTNDQEINFHEFFLPSCAKVAEVYRTLPHLHKPVSGLLHDLSSKYKKVVVIHDSLMSSVVEEVTKIQNAEAYNFCTISAFSIFFNIWQAIPEKPFVLDPSIALPISLPSVEEWRHTSDFAAFAVQQLKLNFTIEKGRLYNTSRVIEGTYISLLEKLLPSKKHFGVGPFNSKNIVSGSPTTKSIAVLEDTEQVHPHTKHRCLQWLDSQLQKDSVIYVSFGTTMTLQEKSIHELALGLEKSGQKFIWVLRNADRGNILAAGDEKGQDDANKLLPEGFVERVGSNGMVVTEEWVPQIEILGHPSIGGFMAHCGWGSVTESMSLGVPVIAYPLHSDQPLNSVLVTQVLKVGLLIRDDIWETRDQIITSDVVENAVKTLMATDEGEEMRKRAKELSQAIRGSMADGGASRLDMDSFIAHITRS